MSREKDDHDMRAIGYLLNRWGRMLELMRFWHGFPTIEATYRAFFGPGAFSGGKIPIPNVDSDVIQLNLRILALSQVHQDALLVFYGAAARADIEGKDRGGFYSDAEKARVLKISEIELKSRVHFAKKELLRRIAEKNSDHQQKQLLSNSVVVESSNLANCHSTEIEPA